MELLEVIMLSIRIGDLELAHHIKMKKWPAREIVSADLKQQADAL